MIDLFKVIFSCFGSNRIIIFAFSAKIKFKIFLQKVLHWKWSKSLFSRPWPRLHLCKVIEFINFLNNLKLTILPSRSCYNYCTMWNNSILSQRIVIHMFKIKGFGLNNTKNYGPNLDIVGGTWKVRFQVGFSRKVGPENLGGTLDPSAHYADCCSDHNGAYRFGPVLKQK